MTADEIPTFKGMIVTDNIVDLATPVQYMQQQLRAIVVLLRTHPNIEATTDIAEKIGDVTGRLRVSPEREKTLARIKSSLVRATPVLCDYMADDLEKFAETITESNIPRAVVVRQPRANAALTRKELLGQACDLIVQAVADYASIRLPAKILAQNSERNVVRARKETMWIAHKLINFKSYREMTPIFNLHLDTIRIGIAEIETLMIRDRVKRRELNELLDRLSIDISANFPEAARSAIAS